MQILQIMAAHYDEIFISITATKVAISCAKQSVKSHLIAALVAVICRRIHVICVICGSFIYAKVEFLKLLKTTDFADFTDFSCAL